MTSPRPGHRRVRLMAVFAALALAAPLAAVPTDPAAAAEPATRVTLSAATTTASTLTLRGTVTNTGDAPLSEVTVALWRSSALLYSPRAVRGALTATTTTPGTARVVETANQSRVAVGSDTLGPGETRPFTVSGTLSALGLTAPNATWWAGVDATGRAGGRAVQQVGSTRTLVSRSARSVPLVTVAEFSAPPRQVKQDLFRDDDLAAELAGGRLDQMLDAVSGGGVGWVVDPSLLAEVQDMADGYRVQTPDGSVAGTGTGAAAAWLERLAALPTRLGAAELYGSPDLTGLAALADGTVLDAVTAATEEGAPDDLPAMTVLDRPDATSLDLAARFGATVVVAVDPDAEGVRLRAADVDVVAATPPAREWSSPLMPDTTLNRRAARLALARAVGGEVRWARSPDDLAADPVSLPPGFTRATLADVLALTPQDWTPPPARSPAGTALDADRLQRVLVLRDEMTAYGDAAPASGIGPFVDAQTARAASRWWVADAAGQDAWLSAIERRIAVPGGQMVSLDASPTFSMTGPTSEFPVTVTNHLMDPVTVQLVAATDNPQRIRLVAPDPVTIASGASSTVLLQAEAVGGGVVRARVHVQTPDGHRLTPDREIAVETTNFGTVGWVIVVASGVVLVVTTAHRIRQVRAQRKGEDG